MQIVRRHDVVPTEHAVGLVAGQLHADTLARGSLRRSHKNVRRHRGHGSGSESGRKEARDGQPASRSAAGDAELGGGAGAPGSNAVPAGFPGAIKLERENNRRSRRLTTEEEKSLLEASTGILRTLIIAALDTGMRRGELLALRFGDVDLARGRISIRAENAKSKKERSVPIATARLKKRLSGCNWTSPETRRPTTRWCSRIGQESR